MFMSFKDESGELQRVKIPVIDGAFSYAGPISNMEMMTIWPNVERTIKRTGNGYYPAKSSQFQFVAFPGANVKFTGSVSDFVDAYPSGDPVNNDLNDLNRAINPLMNKSVNLSVKIANKVITDSFEIAEARSEIKRLNDNVTEIKKNFIIEHPSSPVSAWYLADMMLRNQISHEVALDLYGRLNEKPLQNNSFFTNVTKRVNGILATAVGKSAPSIRSRHTYNGENFDLDALKGKYVVLDFWGTWCGPCIAGMPSLKKYLDKYDEMLEIVGVASESDDGTRWRKFLDGNPDYQWHQVLSRPDEDFILKYNVAGFPTKIIIDPEGKIVERFVGEGDSFYHALDTLLGGARK